MANWHPLTWASHMLDAELFGADPAPMRTVNVLLHAARAGALLLLLRTLTGALWPSAFAAAFFALHPLRVESVVWVSERKDALSTLLLLLAAGTWLRRQRRTGGGVSAAALLLFALALAAKQLVVTGPLLLLLLAYWPLGRVPPRGDPGRRRALAGLATGLLPFALLAVAAAGGAFLAQRAMGAVQQLAVTPLPVRLGNAALSYLWYLGATAWPRGLAVYYPHPEGSLSAGAAAGAALLLSGATALALRGALRRPWLAVGWLWYLAALLPVIGIVQVGSQARADRFSYLPSIGLAVAIAWGVEAATRRLRGRALVLAPAALALLAALAVASRAQTRWWSDELRLYDRALAVTSRNWLMQNNRGVARERRGDLAGAEEDYREALRFWPEYNLAASNLGRVLAREGRLAEAEEALRRAADLAPRDPDPLAALGQVLLATGRPGEAERTLREALALDPGSVPAKVNLSAALARHGRLGEAERLLRGLLEADPDLAVAHMNLGNVLGEQGRVDEALAELREAVRLAPEAADPRFNLGITLERLGRRGEALGEYRAALRAEPGHAGAAAGAARLGGD